MRLHTATVAGSGLAHSPPERFRFLRALLWRLRGRWISLNRSNKEHTTSCRLPISASPSLSCARSRARGITQPFPVQQMVVRDALAGHDLLVQSPTGSGKTLAFGVPLVDRVEPGAKRALRPSSSPRPASCRARSSTSCDSVAEARGLRIAAVYGGVGFGPQSAAARRADILVATPGRLEDLIGRGVVSLEPRPRPRPRRGRPHARHGLQAGRRPDRRPDPGAAPDPVLLGDAGGRDRQARRRLHPRRPPPHPGAEPSATRPTSSTASSTSTRQSAKLDHLVEQLRDDERGRTLVFVRTKRGADRLVKRLRSREVEAVAMHGDKSQRQRERALARFERGEVDALVATDVAARGIDVDDITHVSTSTPPGTATPTCTGSAAPAAPGARGTGISFVLADQADEVRRIAGDLGLVPRVRGGPRRPPEAGQLAARRQEPPPRRRSAAGRDPGSGIGRSRHRAGRGRRGDDEPRLAAQAPRLPARRAGPASAGRCAAPARLAASRWFAAGWGLAAVAWLVHVAALSMAPISLVQAVLAGGAVTLAVMSQRLFGDPVERRQWLALLLGGAGLALLVVTVPHFDGSHSELLARPASSASRAGWRCSPPGLALGHRSERLAARRGVLLAVLAGTLFALAGIAIKGLTGDGGVSLAVLAPWIAAHRSLCGVLAQYAAVAALQRGGAIETIGLMGLVANAAQIARRRPRLRRPALQRHGRHRPAGDRLRHGLRLGPAPALPRERATRQRQARQALIARRRHPAAIPCCQPAVLVASGRTGTARKVEAGRCSRKAIPARGRRRSPAGCLPS